jgi:hypothetical protein
MDWGKNGFCAEDLVRKSETCLKDREAEEASLYQSWMEVAQDPLKNRLWLAVMNLTFLLTEQ